MAQYSKKAYANPRLNLSWYHVDIMKRRTDQNGFTLLELFVVVAALGIALLVVFFMRSGS